MSPPVILSIAGSDSSAGAGIQADLKTAAALGAYAATAITAITAQNTQGVREFLALPPELVRAQIRAVFDDLPVAAVKAGMLANAAIIAAVAEELVRHPLVPLVLDPVMRSTSGHSLIGEDGEAALSALFPRATLLTPNLPEAEALLDRQVRDVAAMHEAAAELVQRGAAAVLLKGGHLPEGDAVDVLATADSIREFRTPRIHTTHTHGTGCTLSSAIAVGFAAGLPLVETITRARAYLSGALVQAWGPGQGRGPVEHFWAQRRHLSRER